MSVAIIEATLRGILGRRRSLLVALLAAVPVLIAIIIRLGGRSTGNADELTANVLDVLVVRAVLPLVALVFGTVALGSELEDGTAVYLLVKPIERWRIVAAKLAVAAGLTLALAFPATLLSGLVVGMGRGGESVAIGFTLAVGVGAIVYSAVFVALSVMTGRALVIGLAYTLLWEGLLAGLFEGTAVLSVRQYTLALAGWLSGAEDLVESLVPAPNAVVLAIVVFGVALAVAARRLAAWEVRSAD